MTPRFSKAIDANPQTGGPADAQRYLRSKDYGFFFQDDWKVKPNFTLNLGLRYEYFSPFSDAKITCRISNFRPAVCWPIPAWGMFPGLSAGPCEMPGRVWDLHGARLVFTAIQ